MLARHQFVADQFAANVMLTDGGLETELVFHDGMDLPLFSSFPLMASEEGRERLRRYFDDYLIEAARVEAGFVLETPTWRGSRSWARQLGFEDAEIDALNRASVELLSGVRKAYAGRVSPILISGNIGPAGDGYVASDVPSVDEADRHHRHQIDCLAGAGADLVSAFTLTNIAEGAGIARAAGVRDIPVVLSFTLETDGALPSGESLREAVETIDAMSRVKPIHYMINCAHPDHFIALFDEPADWHRRIGGIRANASRKSHAELDEATELDDGDPAEFGMLYARLNERLPHLRVFGGCCGTDCRHVASASSALCGV